MITEIEVGHIIYDDLAFMGLERRLKGHLKTGSLDGESPMVSEKVPDEGMIVIIPKSVSNDKTYFNNCVVEVNILLPDVEDETNIKLNELFRKAYEKLNDDVTGEYDGTWYHYFVRSHGIEDESRMKCHYVNISVNFEILNIRS